MWVIFKLLVAGFGFYFRARSISFDKQLGSVHIAEGETIKCNRYTHKGTVYWTQFAVRLEIPCAFKLTREKWYDRFFKLFGWTVEIQAGDSAFDKLVYIACDHPFFAKEIQLDRDARQLVAQLLTDDYRYISCDGQSLFVRFKGDEPATDKLLPAISRLKKQFLDVGAHQQSLLSDPFIKRAILIEALIWSFAGYAIAGMGEWMWNKQDIHLDSASIMWSGLKFGGLAGAVLLTLVVLLLAGSSRGHRIIIESILVVSFSLPFGGIHLASDLNRHLDRSIPVILPVEVVNMDMRLHRGRRGRRWYSYHMFISHNSATKFDLPSEFEVNSEVYGLTTKGMTVPIEVRQGWLNRPWIVSVNGVEY